MACTFRYSLLLIILFITYSFSTDIVDEELLDYRVPTLTEKKKTDTDPLIQLKYAEISDDRLEEIQTNNSTDDIVNSYLQAFHVQPEEDTSNCAIVKYIGIFGISVVPILPQLAITLKVGEYYGSTIFGYCLTVPISLYIAGTTSWMILELIDDTYKLVQDSRVDQTNASCSRRFARGIGLGVLSFMLGSLASAPEIYKVYKYNTIKHFTFISFVYDTIPRTLGYYKLFSSLKFHLNKCYGEENIELEEGRKYIELSKAYFLMKCKETSVSKVSSEIETFSNPNEIYSYLSPNSEEEVSEPNSPAKCIYNCTKQSSRYLSLMFPIATATFNFVLANKGYGLVFGNNVPLNLTLSVLSVCPTFVLNSFVMMNACGASFDKINDCRLRTPSSNYFSSFHPDIKVIFTTSSILLGLATTFGGFYIISDNLSDTPLSSVKYVFASLGIVTGLIFDAYTIDTVLTNFGEVIKSKTDKESSYILKCLKKLDGIKESLVKSSAYLINKFVKNFKPSSTID